MEYIITRTPDFVVDPEIEATQKWQTTITWASLEDRTNPDLLSDTVALEADMVSRGETYLPPILLDPVTAVRRFPTEAFAQAWIAAVQGFASTHNCTIVSAVVNELP